MPDDRPDPRLAAEPLPAEMKRRIDELATDLPEIGRIGLEAIVRKHNPAYNGSADSAGRVGLRSGQVSELTAIGRLKPGGADRLGKILGLTGGNMDGAERVSTLHDMRFVFFDDDERVLFATAYDGDWDTYIDDFATKIPDLMDLIFANIEGWPGITSPKVKDWIAGTQITAAGWFVANPRVTVVDVRQYQRMVPAVQSVLDEAAKAQLPPGVADAVHRLSDIMTRPVGVDY